MVKSFFFLPVKRNFFQSFIPLEKWRPAPTHAPARPSQPAYAADDDDIQEVAPIVKSEPAAAEPAYQATHQGVVADPNMEGYGEEYGDYEGYEEGDYEGAMMDPNGNKGKLTAFKMRNKVFLLHLIVLLIEMEAHALKSHISKTHKMKLM